MSKQKLRDDHECQNCGHTVEKNYCPNCGQKNTETRQSFWHLFTHFIEDLTHYDGAFWKTIKYLLFRPAKLTKEYLEGKRMAYVPPVKLYIFISFVTFFVPAIMPSPEENIDIESSEENTELHEEKSSLEYKEDIWTPDFTIDNTFKMYNPIAYSSLREMDSIEALKPDSLKLVGFEYARAKNLIKLYKHNTPEEVGDKFLEAAPKNISKAIFFYMPIFAFWLWLFHGKKRWYFFDHGIFTLHYFSFLLLTSTIIVVLIKTIGLVNDNSGITQSVLVWTILGILCWQIYYFYRGHRKMYRERWIINSFKSTTLFIINFLSIIILLLIFLLITFHNLH